LSKSFASVQTIAVGAAAPSEMVHGLPGHVFAVQQNAAAVRRQEAADHVEGG